MADGQSDAAGWRADPNISGQERYWDGHQWTAYTQPAGTAQQRLASSGSAAPLPSAEPPAPPSRHPQRKTGRWYLVVPAASLGIATFVPFLHAAGRLSSRRSWMLAIGYTAASAVALFITGAAPVEPSGQNSLLANIGVSLLFLVAASSYLVLPRMRRQVYGEPESQRLPTPGESPAIDAALSERAKRRTAAQLVASDPNLARELHIGRPDLQRSYDDGGLVDLNAFAAAELSRYLGLPAEVADRLVDARERLEGFSSLEEACGLAGVSESTAALLADRCVVLPLLS